MSFMGHRKNQKYTKRDSQLSIDPAWSKGLTDSDRLHWDFTVLFTNMRTLKFKATFTIAFFAAVIIITITSNEPWNGEGKRRNEFAEWHVAWLAEWHNYAECKIWKLAQRNKLNWKACARHCRAFFGANLSEQLLHWFMHLGIYLKHTWELPRVPEGSLQTKTLKSGKCSEAWPK